MVTRVFAHFFPFFAIAEVPSDTCLYLTYGHTLINHANLERNPEMTIRHDTLSSVKPMAHNLSLTKLTGSREREMGISHASNIPARVDGKGLLVAGRETVGSKHVLQIIPNRRREMRKKYREV